MRNISKRILSFLSVFAILFSLSLPVYADDITSETDSFWAWWAHLGTTVADETAGGIPLVGALVNWITSVGSGAVCPVSDDHWHHASRVKTRIQEADGTYSGTAVCSFCSADFEYKVSPSDLQSVYNDYVETLPATAVTSVGHLIWKPTIHDLASSSRFYDPFKNDSSHTFRWNSSLPYSVTDSYDMATTTISSSDVYSVNMSVIPNGTHKNFGLSSLYFQSYFFCPVAGSYKTLSAGYIYSYLKNDGTLESDNVSSSFSSSFVHRAAGSSFYDSFGHSWNTASSPTVTIASCRFTLPTYEIIPDSAVDVSGGDIYNTDNRVGSIIGDYGIIGDNGTINKTDNNYIVNETNNTVYNPVTGDTYNIIDWTYDYSTRTYTVTTDNSQTITVNYGDEYVTINEGDTVYNIYYIIQGGGDTPVDPDVCQHTYTSTTDREPTCTVPGSKTLTCSKCGDVKTESIPAKGHTWTVKQQVQTVYDENGVLVTQGYTIYQCSVCSEQYKDINGTGPPGGSGGEDGKESIWDKLGNLIGSIAGGFMEVIEAVISKILGYLESLVNTINEKIGLVVDSILGLFDRIPSLFGGFTAFLTAVFPFIPQEFWDVLLLGVCLLVVSAIIRFFIKR